MPVKRNARAARGYMLMEVMIGGALAAVAIVALLTQLSQARVKNTTSGREVTSSQLVMDKIAEMRLQVQNCTWPPNPALAPLVNPEDPVSGVTGKYKREVFVTDPGNTTITIPGTASTYSVPTRNVRVVVSFIGTRGDGDVGDGMHFTDSTIQLYQVSPCP